MFEIRLLMPSKGCFHHASIGAQRGSTLAMEEQCRGLANPLARPGDKGPLAAKLVIHIFSPVETAHKKG
jgi:hypothetical protein